MTTSLLQNDCAVDCNIVCKTQKCCPIFAATTLSQCHNDVMTVTVIDKNAAI